MLPLPTETVVIEEPSKEQQKQNVLVDEKKTTLALNQIRSLENKVDEYNKNTPFDKRNDKDKIKVEGNYVTLGEVKEKISSLSPVDVIGTDTKTEQLTTDKYIIIARDAIATGGTSEEIQENIEDKLRAFVSVPEAKELATMWALASVKQTKKGLGARQSGLSAKDNRLIISSKIKNLRGTAN